MSPLPNKEARSPSLPNIDHARRTNNRRNIIAVEYHLNLFGKAPMKGKITDRLSMTDAGASGQTKAINTTALAMRKKKHNCLLPL